MKISHLLLTGIAAALLISGCTRGPRPPRGDAVDTSLPVISLDGHMEDMKSVSFEWDQINDDKVEGILVYRNKQRNDKDMQIKRYDVVPSRFYTHYTDNDLEPNSRYEYSFTTFSKTAQSDKSVVVTVVTPPVLDSVPMLRAVQHMPRVVKILWKPIENPIVSGYIIEKRSSNDLNFKQLAKVPGRLSMEYVDTNLQDGEKYSYRIEAYTYNGILSAPSDVAEATTKLLPPDIQDLQATRNLPKKIKLTWQPTPIKDFAYYKVYRSTRDSGRADYYAKVDTNQFTDEIKEDGAQFYYRVTVVDQDGLESNTETPLIRGASIPAIKAPTDLKIQVTDKKLEISWEDDDPRVVTYKIIKGTRTSWLSSSDDKTIDGIKKKMYTDADVYSGDRYSYKVIAMDKDGMESEPSRVAQISSNSLNDRNAKNKPEETKKETQKQDTKQQQPKKAAPQNTDTNTTIKAAPNLDTSTL